MVRHFIRLKLRLLANRLRTQSVVGMIGYVAVWMAGVVGGVLGGLGVYALGRLLDSPDVALILAYTLVFVGWVVLPASVSALDETLDPRRFELLPLTPRRLSSGLLIAGAVSPGGMGTFLGLAVATIVSFPGWPVVPIVAVLVELAMCLVVARLVTSVLSNLLSSRRTRDLVTLLFGLFFAVVVFLPAALDGSLEDEGPGVEITVTSLDWIETLVWLPPGAVARSVTLAEDGQVLASVGLLAYGVLATLLIGLAWSRSVRKMLTTSPTVGRTGRRRNDVDRVSALIPPWLRLRPGPVAGVVAKELRYLMRDNRARSQLLGSVLPIVVIGFLSQRSFADAEHAPLLATGIAVLIFLGILSNQFGFDGGSFWGYVVTPASLVSVIRGKNLGWGLVASVPVMAGAMGLAIWSGHYEYLLAAILGSVAVLLVVTAVGNFTSIYGAYRIPESNPFSSRGMSGHVFVAVVLSMMGSGLLVLPLAVLIGLPAVFLGPEATTAGALIGIGYGALIYWLGMRLIKGLLVEREMILLETIDGERG